MPIVIPDPSLVVLVGAAGSGKSTFARRHFAEDEVLSSDAYRAALTGDETNQAVSALAFRILHRELRARLGAGRLSIVDATNLRRTARRPLLDRARQAGVPAVAIVLALPPRVVLARNAARGRVVDEDVVHRQFAMLERAMAPGGLAEEGFRLVAIIRSAEALDAARVERRPLASFPPG